MLTPTRDWSDAQAEETEIERSNKRNKIADDAHERGDDDISVAEEDLLANLENDNGNMEGIEHNTPEEKWIPVEYNTRRYKAVIELNKLNGEDTEMKLTELERKVASTDHYMGLKIREIGVQKTPVVVVTYGKKEVMLQVCEIDLRENNEFKLRPIPNNGDVETLDRTLIVRDLPLNADKELLRNILERHSQGTIEEIKTRVTGPWLTAHARFSDASAVKKFDNVWSIIYMKDFCRIAPSNASKEDIMKRNEYTLKLANIPFGITAYDLREFLDKINAKICYIPRSRERYERKRIAFISFENLEELEKAKQEVYTMKGVRLFWLDTSTKTCHKCGSPNHLVKECNERKESFFRKQKLAQYSKIYTKYKTPNYRRATNLRTSLNSQGRLYTNYIDQEIQENDEQTEQTKGKNETVPSAEANLWETLKNINDNINDIKKELKVVNERITKLEVSKFNNNRNKAGLVNDQGHISNYQANRRFGNLSRKYDENQNNNNKRTAKKTEETVVSPNDDIEANKRKKILIVEDKQQISKDKEKVMNNNLDTVDGLKNELNKNWNKINNLESNIAQLTELIKGSLGDIPNIAGGSSNNRNYHFSK